MKEKVIIKFNIWRNLTLHDIFGYKKLDFNNDDKEQFSLF